MAAAVEAGRRVLIRPPSARDRDELLALMKSSRGFLRPWVEPIASGAAFAAYLRRARQPSERRFLVGRREDSAIVGVINVSQIVHGNFRSAYLGFYAGAPFAGKGYFRREGFSPRYLKIFGRWRDHERWAVTVEDFRR